MPPEADQQQYLAAGRALNRPTLIPDKGQFRSRFHHPLSYCCPTTIFLALLNFEWVMERRQEAWRERMVLNAARRYAGGDRSRGRLAL
jgi:hypothetical protein